MRLAKGLDTMCISRVANRPDGHTVVSRPYQTMSDVDLIGVGQGPILGEVRRVHQGMLMLDALQE